MKKTLSLLLATGLSLTCLSGGLLAKGLPAEKTELKYRETADGEGALTKQMIEDCIVLKTSMEEKQTAFSEKESQRKTIHEEMKEIHETLEKVEKEGNIDPSDSKEVAAYKEKQGLFFLQEKRKRRINQNHSSRKRSL